MSYLNNLLKKVNLIACELMGKLRSRFELPVKPVVIARIGHKLVKLLDKQLQVRVKANHFIINNCHVKSPQISNHKTNMQNSS